MKPQTFDISKLNASSIKVDTSKATINLGDMYGEGRANVYEYKLYVAHYNLIPNSILQHSIDCRKAHLWFTANFSAEILAYNYTKRWQNSTKQIDYFHTYYFLFDDLMIYFNIENDYIHFLFNRTDLAKVNEFIEKFEAFKPRKQRTKPQISLLVNSGRSITTHDMEVPKSNLKIENNYNNDFKEIHQIIFKRLSKKNDKGLVLLHGKPGTGKTSYIRYLITALKKNIIFLPPSMASAITNPDLLSILINNPNSILVIEDAENIVVDRETEGQSQVSALLNISDGLLSDCLNIQIICTFNTDISKVDSALLRKGRLIASYEFKELETEKAQQLSEKLGFNTSITSPMALTEIYNQAERGFVQTMTKTPIGFKKIKLN